jgi:hypothetical protein
MKADQRRAVAEMVSDELPEESIYWLIVFFKSVLVVVEI